VGLAGLLAWAVPAIPGDLVAWGRNLPTRRGQMQMLYVGEGMNSSVAVSLYGGDVRNFHVSGKIEASTEPQDMRLQRMLGHIPALLHPNPRSVLIVGCGAGVTAGSFVVHSSVERIVLCEIEPLIPQVVAQYFAAENHGLLSDPRVEVVHDDARHYILTTREKFDIITSDPIHPWVKGAATLYTKEYFELCKRRLNPGGLVTQWVPLYESDPETVKSEVATFFDVFPRGTVWGNELDGKGYDTILLGQAGDMTIDVKRLQYRLASREYAEVAESLKEVGFKGVFDLLGTYAGRARELRPWLQGAAINRDRDLRLQYLAGMGLNQELSGAIYDSMLAYRTFPDDLFIAEDWRREALRVLMRRGTSIP
jgi:spermidine synthase